MEGRNRRKLNGMSDFLIIGGGIIDLLLARELSAEGATVTIIERGECGKEASWAGGGILSPLLSLALYTVGHCPSDCRRRPLQPWQADCLRRIDPEWERNGLLMLAAKDASEALEWAKCNGSVIDALPSASIYGREPALAAGFTSGLWMPEIANIRNPRLLKALLKSLQLEPRVHSLQHSCVKGLISHSIQGERSVRSVEIVRNGQ